MATVIDHEQCILELMILDQLTYAHHQLQMGVL